MKKLIAREDFLRNISHKTVIDYERYQTSTLTQALKKAILLSAHNQS